MTLQGMNSYLIDKGFKVHRSRDSKRDLYIFTISKPGYENLTKEFKYPKSDDYRYRDSKMREFLDGMVRDFYKGEEKEDMNAYKFEHPVFQTRGDAEATIPNYRVSYCDYSYVPKTPMFGRLPEITNVIYNDPATIVFWADGTKTVVKVQEGYDFDPMAGLSMAICEKAFCSKANSHKVFNKWLPKEEEPMIYPEIRIENEALAKVMKDATNAFHEFCDKVIARKKGREEV